MRRLTQVALMGVAGAGGGIAGHGPAGAAADGAARQLHRSRQRCVHAYYGARRISAIRPQKTGTLIAKVRDRVE